MITRFHYRYRLSLVGCLILSLSLPLIAEIKLTNPAIPGDEYLSYVEKIGPKSGSLEQQFHLRSENGKSWYEFDSSSAASTIRLIMDPDTLFARHSDVTTTTADAVIRRTSDILETTIKLKDDELAIPDFNALAVMLRGFPWGKTNFARLVFLGSGGMGGFTFELSVQGKESLKLAGKSYDCWKAQLALGGLMGAMYGKTQLWYSTQPPHYLVRAEGPSAGPGSPNRVVELVSYRTGSTN